MGVSKSRPRSFTVSIMRTTWTPKVCRIMAFWTIFRGIGRLFTYFGGLGIIYSDKH